MRVYTTSLGLDPGALASGRDLVLDIDIGHGAVLPDGVFAHDSLGLEERRQADALALESLDRWRREIDESMTVDGVCWSWIWEWRLHLSFFPWLHRALALRRAVELHGADTLTVMDSDPGTWALATTVGEQLGLPVRLTDGAKAPPPDLDPFPTPAPHVRARRAALEAAKRVGMPSLLRRDCVVFHSYWPLEPVLDAMLEAPDWRPAVCLEKLPTGAHRWLRAAMQGGWTGLPTAWDLMRARRRTRRLAEVVSRCSLRVDSLDLSIPLRHVLEEELVEHGHLLADAPMLRRAFRRGRVRWVLGAYDSAPHARLVISLANEAGIPTLGLSHGAYLVPQTMPELDICDEAALWTLEVAPLMERWDRPVHLIGYPVPRRPRPAKRTPAPPARPRVLVLGQYANRHIAVVDKRLTGRSWEAAVGAVLARLPDARLVLRPHPGERFATARPLRERFPGVQLTIDRTTPIMDLLEEADLCIGGTSTATLEAALAGTPVIVLNLSGFDWPWPLGGDTAVPLARSRAELEAALERFAREGSLPGQDDMLAALGAYGGDPAAELLGILAAGPGGAGSRSLRPVSALHGRADPGHV